jgi:hypothetical protein
MIDEKHKTAPMMQFYEKTIHAIEAEHRSAMGTMFLVHAKTTKVLSPGNLGTVHSIHAT